MLKIRKIFFEKDITTILGWASLGLFIVPFVTQNIDAIHSQSGFIKINVWILMAGIFMWAHPFSVLPLQNTT